MWRRKKRNNSTRHKKDEEKHKQSETGKPHLKETNVALEMRRLKPWKMIIQFAAKSYKSNMYC